MANIFSHIKEAIDDVDDNYVLDADDNEVRDGDTVTPVEDIEQGFEDGGRTPKIKYKAGEELTVEFTQSLGDFDEEKIFIEGDKTEYDATLFRKVEKTVKEGLMDEKLGITDERIVINTVDHAIDDIFYALADKFKLINGDFAPEQEVQLDKIKVELTGLMQAYVKQNQTGYENA